LITAAFQAAFVLLKPSEYTALADALDLHNIAGFACAFLFIIAGIKKGYKDGGPHLLSMLIVLVCYVHDTLYYSNVFHDNIGEIFYIGAFLFVFIQMIMQAKQLKEFLNKNAATEMAFLQAQIKPHFLYNALNTFVSVSRYDADKARSLLIDFSNYLRRSFDFKDLSQFTSLKNEIELVKAYVDIAKAQYEERLEVSFDICEDQEINVPVLMLQPVVENAMFHGILPKAEGGLVEISVVRNGSGLDFSVKDNGVGMESEKLQSVLRHESKSGVGLSNIDGRLKRLYGKGLQIKSIPGTGTEVTWSVRIDE
jgi:sensor histidine kinase YesM